MESAQNTPCFPSQEAADEQFMREALAEARLAAQEGEVPIGAVVVCGGEVVAGRTTGARPWPIPPRMPSSRPWSRRRGRSGGGALRGARCT